MGGFDFYRPLFPAILDSSLNINEPLHVRWFFIACLALADADGVIELSAASIGHRANVTPEQAKEAIDRLTSPDAESTSEAEDGRRLIEIDHNRFQLVNADHYHELGRTAAIRRQAKIRKRRQRERERGDRDTSRGDRGMSRGDRDASCTITIPIPVTDNDPSDRSSSGDDDTPTKSKPDVDWKDLERRWNEFAQANGLAQIRTITKSRKGHVRERVREYGPDAIDRLFEELARIGPNMLGENDIGGWSITFDYCFRPSKFGPIVEGAHRRRDRSKRSGSGDEFADALAAQWDDG